MHCLLPRSGGPLPAAWMGVCAGSPAGQRQTVVKTHSYRGSRLKTCLTRLTSAASACCHPASLAATRHRLLVLPEVCDLQRCSCSMWHFRVASFCGSQGAGGPTTATCHRSHVPGLVSSDRPAGPLSQAPKALEDLTGLTELHASAAAYDPGRDDSDGDAAPASTDADDDDAWTSI